VALYNAGRDPADTFNIVFNRLITGNRYLKLVKDPVHGEVIIEDEDLPILDSPGLQRLRRIKQIGLGDLVYPGANHTRFEHALGTMYIAREVGTRMGLDLDSLRTIRISALLHDVGHGPFSHTSEKFSMASSGIDHSYLTEKEIRGGRTSDILASMDIDPEEVSRVASGKCDGLGRLLHSQVGVDRMDYLMRDAHYTGVAYGVIDYDRIIGTLIFHGGEIAIREKGSQAAESLLVARFLMYPAVYLHHVSRIADAMMLRALESLREAGRSVEEIMSMDDVSLTNELLTGGGTGSSMMRRILDRNLYKRAIYISREEVPDMDYLLDISGSRDRIRELEDEVASEAGLDSGGVLVDIQSPPELDEMGIKVLRGNQLEYLRERSPLVMSLRDAQWNYWRFGVYCPRENLDRVRKVCEGHGWRQLEE